MQEYVSVSSHEGRTVRRAQPVDFGKLVDQTERTTDFEIEAGRSVGHVAVDRVRRGLKTTGIEIALQDAVTARFLAKPCLQVGLCFRGGLTTGRQGRESEIRPNQAFVTAVGAPTEWHSRIAAGVALDAFHVVASADWLADSGFEGLGACLPDAPASTRCAAGTQRLVALGRRLKRQATPGGFGERLQKEALTLQFIAEALALCGLGPTEDNTAQAGSVRERRRIERVQEMLDQSDPAQAVSLTDLAREAGMSVSTLCRSFKATVGTSVCGYVFETRMQRAHAALLLEGATVAQAAWQAGYANPANFATAFRRHFGLAPSEAARG